MSGEFATDDADLAAFLRCRHIRYTRLQHSPSKPEIIDFVFPETEALFACLREWMDEGESCFVDAREYGRFRHDTIRAARRFVQKTA